LLSRFIAIYEIDPEIESMFRTFGNGYDDFSIVRQRNNDLTVKQKYQQTCHSIDDAA